MSYSNIKKILSAALLVVFTAPTTLAISGYDSDILRDTVDISGATNLTSKNNLINLSLRDSDVKQVLRMFADKAGMNIVFHKSVEGNVTLDLVEVPVNDAFQLVMQIANLNYYKQGKTLIVMSKDSPDNAAYSKQDMMIFPIHYVSAAKIADFLNKNVFGMKKAGLSSVDAATVNSATNELIVFGMPSDVAIVKKVIEQFDREPFSKTFTVNHTTPAEMANMICQMLLPSRGSDFGGKTAYNGGFVTGAAASAPSGGGSELKLGEGVVACSIAPKTSDKTLAPFDVQNLSITYFPQRGTITLMGGSETQAEMIEKFIKTNDIKQPQAFLEVSIVELSEDGSKTFNNNWAFSSNGWGFSFDGSSFSASKSNGDTGFVDATRYFWSNGTKDGSPTWNETKGEWTVPTQVTQTYKILPTSTYISWSMNYLIENRKARVLANPKILITNGQESAIDLTEDYVEKVTSEYLTSTSNGQGASGTAQKTYSIGKDLGIKVTLTPFISPEGYVTLNIKPEYSTVADQIYAASSVLGTQDLAATLLSRRNLDLKNVRIKDGETLILGGLIQEGESKTVKKIPILGDLPVVGTLFRSTGTTKTKSELVIMITPKILNDDEGTIADKL